jgi:hypothetical protein
VPLVLILAFPFSIADRAVRNQLVTVAVKFYSGIVSFGMMYSLPLLIVERQIGFRNVLSSLGQSLKEPVLTVLLVLPTYILGLFQLLLTQNSATGVALRFLQACVSYFVVLLAFFLYASFVNLKYNRSPKAL